MQLNLFNNTSQLNYTYQTKTPAAFIKRIILVMIVVLIATVKLSAQWTTAGSITSTTNNVGIGTTAPTALLHLKGSGTTNATSSLIIMNSAGTQAFRVSDNGTVGIGVAVGTTFPQNKLGIYAAGTDALGAYVTMERQVASGLIGGIRFATGYLNAANANLPYTAGIESYGTGGVDQMDLRFYTSYGPGQQNIERIRIMQTGQVGIGTSSPVTKLDVVGLGAGNIDFQTTGRVKIYGSAPGVSFNDGTSERSFLGWAGSGIANHAVGVYTATGGWNTLNVMTNGAIAIGAQATNTNAKLDVTGNIFANNKVLIGMSGLSAADYTAKITPYALAVNGDAIFNKVKVKLYASWPDFVFEEKYGLLPLTELEQYIKTNKHLPDVPTAADVEKDGIDVGDNQTILLKKVEELTLYLIEQNKKLALQGNEISNLKLQLSKLEKK